MSVRIGACTSPADATLVRAMFDAHGIDVTIAGEQHASLLGPLNGSFISLDIWVQPDDAERASELLADMRAKQAEHTPPDEDEDDDERQAGASLDMRLARRKRTGVALLLAFCVSFGTAHLSAGAWLRGLVLAGVEIFGISRLGGSRFDQRIGGAIIVAAIVCDAVGAVMVLRKKLSMPEIPKARVV